MSRAKALGRARTIAVALSANAGFMALGAIVGHWAVWAVILVVGFVVACVLEVATDRAAADEATWGTDE